MIKNLNMPPLRSELGFSESIETVVEWSDYYLNILEKMKNDQPLDRLEDVAVRYLLLDQGRAMKADPEKYVLKKVGRPNAGTNRKVILRITMLLRIQVAKNKEEAIQMTASYFDMSYEAVKQASKGLSIRKLNLPKKGGN